MLLSPHYTIVCCGQNTDLVEVAFVDTPFFPRDFFSLFPFFGCSEENCILLSLKMSTEAATPSREAQGTLTVFVALNTQTPVLGFLLLYFLCPFHSGNSQPLRFLNV